MLSAHKRLFQPVENYSMSQYQVLALGLLVNFDRSVFLLILMRSGLPWAEQ